MPFKDREYFREYPFCNEYWYDYGRLINDVLSRASHRKLGKWQIADVERVDLETQGWQVKDLSDQSLDEGIFNRWDGSYFTEVVVVHFDETAIELTRRRKLVRID